MIASSQRAHAIAFSRRFVDAPEKLLFTLAGELGLGPGRLLGRDHLHTAIAVGV
jgi:hypothetical protein